MSTTPDTDDLTDRKGYLDAYEALREHENVAEVEIETYGSGPPAYTIDGQPIDENTIEGLTVTLTDDAKAWHEIGEVMGPHSLKIVAPRISDGRLEFSLYIPLEAVDA